MLSRSTRLLLLVTALRVVPTAVEVSDDCFTPVVNDAGGILFSSVRCPYDVTSVIVRSVDVAELFDARVCGPSVDGGVLLVLATADD